MYTFSGTPKRRLVNMGLAVRRLRQELLAQTQRDRERREELRRETAARTVVARAVAAWVARRHAVAALRTEAAAAGSSVADATFVLRFVAWVRGGSVDDCRRVGAVAREVVGVEPEVWSLVVARMACVDVEVYVETVLAVAEIPGVCMRPAVERLVAAPCTPAIVALMRRVLRDAAALPEVSLWLAERTPAEVAAIGEWPEAVLPAVSAAAAPRLLANYAALVGERPAAVEVERLAAVAAVVPAGESVESEVLTSRGFVAEVSALLQDKLVGVLAVLSVLAPLATAKQLQRLFVHLATASVPYFDAMAEAVTSHRVFREVVAAAADDVELANDPGFWKLARLFAQYFGYTMATIDAVPEHSATAVFVRSNTDYVVFMKRTCLALLDPAAVHPSIEVFQRMYMFHYRAALGEALPARLWEYPVKIDQRALAAQEEARLAAEEADSEEDEVVVVPPPLRQLTLLQQLPFLVPFRTRAQLFQQLIELDRQRRAALGLLSFVLFGAGRQFAVDDMGRRRHAGNIRREHAVEDAFAAFGTLGEGLKDQLSIQFFNEVDGANPEAGIDGGGITKEFLTLVLSEATRPGNGYFCEAPGGVYPDPQVYLKLRTGVEAREQHHHLDVYRFLGLVVGKCLYASVLVDVHFSPVFLLKWGRSGGGGDGDNELVNKSLFSELRDLDPELYRHLLQLLALDDATLASLDIRFTTDELVGGVATTLELVPGGTDMVVDDGNRLQYLQAVANFKLNTLLRTQTQAFLEGMYAMVPCAWLDMFNPLEVQLLVSGGERDINIEDLRSHCVLGGFGPEDATVEDFWAIVGGMTPQERFKLVKFITLVPRAPLLGFGALSPQFGLVKDGGDHSRLPTAHTCVNMLKLPDYQDRAMLREKLLYAISAEAGFDLQ